MIFYFYRGVQVTDVPDGVLKGISDRFNGITIDSLNEDVAADKFSQYLNSNKIIRIFKIY